MARDALRWGVKVGSGFGAVSVLLVAIVVASLTGVGAQDRTQEEVAAACRLQAQATTAKFDAADLNGWQTAYALDVVLGTPGATLDQGATRNSFLVAAAAFRADLDSIGVASLSPTERTSLESARRSFDRFMALDDTVIGAYRTGSPTARATANGLVLGDELRLYTDMAGSVDALVAESRRSVDSALASASRNERRTTSLVLALGATALAGAVVLAAGICWSTSRRLRTIGDALDDVAHGDLTVHPMVAGRDEVARMAASLNAGVVGVRAAMLEVGTVAKRLEGDQQAPTVQELVRLSRRLRDLVARFQLTPDVRRPSDEGPRPVPDPSQDDLPEPGPGPPPASSSGDVVIP